MDKNSLSASLLALTAALALSACTTESAPPSASPAAAATGEAQPLEVVTDPAAVLEIEDQTSEGPTVRVTGAAVTEGGFVVVGSDGGRNILGTGLVPPGTEPATLQVALAEDVNEETELTAQLFNDENGDGLFNAGDRPVTNGEDDDDDDAEQFAGERAVFSFKGKSVINS